MFHVKNAYVGFHIIAYEKKNKGYANLYQCADLYLH